MTTETHQTRRGMTPLLVTAIAGTAMITGAASAQTMLTFAVSNSSGNGTFTVDLSDGVINPDGSFFWALPGSTAINDGPNTIATLGSATAFFDFDDALMSSSFAMDAGDSDTTMTITSADIAIGVLNASGRATAGMTTTDNQTNGSTVNGLQAGGTMFATSYNGGNSFANLIQGPLVASSAVGSASDSEDFPLGAGNYSPLGTDATSMMFEWSFEVSAGDQASGTSAYSIIPAPGSAALIGLGLAGMTRRRR